MNRRAGAACVATLALAAATGPAGAEECAENLEGLAAWYRIETLHRRIRDAEEVHEWRDASAHGHHLTDDRNGLSAVFHTLALNGQPVIELGKADSFSVAEPFELDDHTIFLVYAASRPSALLQSRSTGQDGYGIVLREDDAADQFQMGLQRCPYNRDASLQGGFSITVLGRVAGHLRSFVNGADVSSDVACAEPLRVGRFFRLSRTRAVKLDAGGLRVAEMIFFDRYLADAERRQVSECLARDYAIELAEPVAARPPEPTFAEEPTLLLGTTSERNLNGGAVVAVEWNVSRRAGAPFEHDPASEPTKIRCTADGTRVRVALALPLRPATAAAGARVLLLKNNTDYLPEEARPASAENDEVTLRLQADLTLDAGDYLEVVVVGRPSGPLLQVAPDRAELTFRLSTTAADTPEGVERRTGEAPPD